MEAHSTLGYPFNGTVEVLCIQWELCVFKRGMQPSGSDFSKYEKLRAMCKNACIITHLI